LAPESTHADTTNPLGLWAGTGGEGAKFWMGVLVDLKKRGVTDVFFLVCDGLKGLPGVVEAVWPLTTVQTCIIHLIWNTSRLTSRADSDAIKRDIKPIYTAPNADAALAEETLARPPSRSQATSHTLRKPDLTTPATTDMLGPEISVRSESGLPVSEVFGTRSNRGGISAG
jgi:hypothetical protein